MESARSPLVQTRADHNGEATQDPRYVAAEQALRAASEIAMKPEVQALLRNLRKRQPPPAVPFRAAISVGPVKAEASGPDARKVFGLLLGTMVAGGAVVATVRAVDGRRGRRARY